MTTHPAGEQLEGDVLHRRQEQLRASGNIVPAPMVIAVNLTSPENMGAVLRLADAAGSERVILVNDQPGDPTKIRRTARRTEISITWQLSSQAEFLSQAASLPLLIAVELTTTSTNLAETPLPKYCAFVIGSERYGIPSSILNMCVQAVHIPMYGANSSMNVTHALAIALYEWRRQH